MKLVVDASVVIRWFVPVQDSQEALNILAMDRKLVAPMIAKFEIAGALVRWAQTSEIGKSNSSKNLQQWLEAISSNVLRLEDDPIDLSVGAELAVRIDHSVAECIYLAMANRLGVPLVTANDTFAIKAKKVCRPVFSITQINSMAAEDHAERKPKKAHG